MKKITATLIIFSLLLSLTVPAMASGNYVWPLIGHTTITSNFGYRNDPFTGEWKGHGGTDIGAPYGTPVYASSSGTLTIGYNGCPHNYAGKCGCGYTYGNFVYIDDDFGMRVYYAHLTSITASAGRVEQGQQIGTVGSTGNSTGAHLHFEMRTGTASSTRVNPLNYVSSSNQIGSSTPIPTTPDITKVICNTGDASNISATSATFNGSFTNPTGARVIKRGYQWGKTTSMSNYTWFDCDITWDDGLTHNMTGLAPGTTYYYKLIVQGEDGTIIFGNTKSVTTATSGIENVYCTTGDAYNIGVNSATLQGTFTNPSGARIVKRGYQWGKVPTNEGLNHYTWFDCDITWEDGLTHNMTGLQPGTTYYYKLVVQGEDGTIRYGNMKSFTTRTTFDTLTLSTGDAYNITSNSATMWGEFQPNGYTVKQRGFLVGRSASNLDWEIIFDCDITWNDGLTHNQPGLLPGTTYYYKLVVGDGNGNYKYGEVKSFTTNFSSTPTDLWVSSDKQLYFKGDTTTLSFGANQATGYWLDIWKDGEHISSFGLGNTNTYSAIFDNGYHAVFITATNSLGNTTSSAYFFTVANPEYSVKFDANGGNNAPDSTTLPYNSYCIINNEDFPYRNGYTFWGWATSPNASSATYSGNIKSCINNDITLYAFWIKNAVITYNLNGGIGENYIQDKPYGSDVNITYTIPQKEHSNFLGWSKSSTATTPDYMSGDIYSIDEDMTLYAVWEELPYSSFSVQKFSKFDFVTVDLFNIGTGCTVILATYDINGRLVELQTDFYAGETVPFTVSKEYETIKVMVWNNLGTLKPLCEGNSTPTIIE